MQRDDFWITRITDNRVRGILGDLRDAIADCEDPELMHRLRSTLGLGFTNFAATRERELRASATAA